MQTATIVSLIAAPIVGPLIWKVLLWPGKRTHDYLWRRMPDGRLRSLLLRHRG